MFGSMQGSKELLLRITIIKLLLTRENSARIKILLSYKTKYPRMDQVTVVEDIAFKNLKGYSLL